MKKLKLNIKTTLAGIAAGLPVLIVGVMEKDPVKISEGLGLILVGIFSKDASNSKED